MRGGMHAIVGSVASMVPALAARGDMLIVPCAAIAAATNLLPDLDEVVDQGDQRLAQPTGCDTYGPRCHRAVAVWGIVGTDDERDARVPPRGWPAPRPSRPALPPCARAALVHLGGTPPSARRPNRLAMMVCDMVF